MPEISVRLSDVVWTGGFSISTQKLTRPIDHSSITLEWKPHILWCCHSEIMQLPITWLCHNAKDIFYSWLGSFTTIGYRRKSDQEWDETISGNEMNMFLTKRKSLYCFIILLQWRHIQMRIFHSNESCQLAPILSIAPLFWWVERGIIAYFKRTAD